jgi:hypothetical protein
VTAPTTIAFRDDVAYIERMRPEQVLRAAEECKRIADLIGSAVPSLDDAKRRPQWVSDARPLYDQRMKDAVETVDLLHDGYRRAYGAQADYARAQWKAQHEVEAGVALENQLGDTIGTVTAAAAEQSPTMPVAQPMRQWANLRESTGFLDWVADRLAESHLGIDVNEVREKADREFEAAGRRYAQAIRIETEQRYMTLGTLVAARKDLPELVTPADTALGVIRSTPDLYVRRVLDSYGIPTRFDPGEMIEASEDANARRPVGVLDRYQVPPEEMVTYQVGSFGEVAESLIWGDRPRTRTETPSMVKLLGQLSDDELRQLNGALSSAEGHINSEYGHPSLIDHPRIGAEYQMFLSADLTRSLGEERARQYATASAAQPDWSPEQRAMYLYNSELGRSLMHKSSEQIRQAIYDGQALVLDDAGNLRYSDQIPYGKD